MAQLEMFEKERGPDIVLPIGSKSPCCNWALLWVSYNPELWEVKPDDHYECCKCGKKYEKEITAMQAASKIF